MVSGGISCWSAIIQFTPNTVTPAPDRNIAATSTGSGAATARAAAGSANRNTP